MASKKLPVVASSCDNCVAQLQEEISTSGSYIYETISQQMAIKVSRKTNSPLPIHTSFRLAGIRWLGRILKRAVQFYIASGNVVLTLGHHLKIFTEIIPYRISLYGRDFENLKGKGQWMVAGKEQVFRETVARGQELSRRPKSSGLFCPMHSEPKR